MGSTSFLRGLRALTTVGLVLCALGCATGPRQLQPRSAPKPVAPAVRVPPTPVGPQDGRVVFGTTDGPMKVSLQPVDRFALNNQPQLSGYVCTTPCVADLPQGKYKLYLSPEPGGEIQSGDVDSLTVERGTQVYLRAPGHLSYPTAASRVPPVIVVVLSSIAVAPAIMLMVQDGNSGAQAAGAALSIGAAAGLIGGGIWLYQLSRGELQAGSTTLFHVAP